MATCSARGTEVTAVDSLGEKCAETLPPNEQVAVQVDNSNSAPVISGVLYSLALISLVVSLVVCVNLWPSSSYREPDFVSYSASLAWLLAGIAEWAVLSAIGLGLHYLKKIAAK